jgi:hypothetical protein
MHWSIAYIGLFVVLTAVSSARSADPQVIHLWENGAPGFENRKDEPEQAKDWWVKNIHNPSITAFLPDKDKATGAAVLALTFAVSAPQPLARTHSGITGSSLTPVSTVTVYSTVFVSGTGR